MEQPKSLNKIIEASIKKNWDCPALSDYNGVTLYYRDVARRIEKIHIMLEMCGLQRGDKIAICSRNQANWAVSFLAALTYGAVPVPLLHEFKSGNIYHLVNHSESRVLFVGDMVWEGLSQSEMPGLDAIILMNDFSLLYASNDKISHTREHLNELFGKKYPRSFHPDCVNYYEDSPEELAMINYTSGTSGFSKGVMLPYRSLLSNVLFGFEVHGHLDNASNCVSMLPTAHMYGMMFEFLVEFCSGSHVHFLTRLPTPKIILDAMGSVKPDLIVTVPLVIEKIYKKKLEPIINRRDIRLLLRLPVIDEKILKKINHQLDDAFGGKFDEVIIGGAAFNREAEAFFRRIGFRFTVGYGMTECGPIITYARWNQTKLYSCGKAAPRMQIMIDSSDPANIPGEILVKGDNVFLGYYKNEQATAEAFTEDGWFRTGDMGVIDSDGFLFIKGRCKSMILGPSGQNIYPEEIEGEINNMPYVIESLVIEDNGGLRALVYPDSELAVADGLSKDELLAKIQQSIKEMNAHQPNYCKVGAVELFPEEFEKTPKKSIKRYLYQRTQNQ